MSNNDEVSLPSRVPDLGSELLTAAVNANAVSYTKAVALMVLPYSRRLFYSLMSTSAQTFSMSDLKCVSPAYGVITITQYNFEGRQPRVMFRRITCYIFNKIFIFCARMYRVLVYVCGKFSTKCVKMWSLLKIYFLLLFPSTRTVQLL